MNRFLRTMMQQMADNVRRFWLVEQNEEEVMRCYKDFPVSPFGPTRLVSKETINELIK